MNAITITALDEQNEICVSVMCDTPEAAVDFVNGLIDEMFEDMGMDAPAHLKDFEQLQKHLKDEGGYHAVLVQGWGQYSALKGLS